MPKAGMYPTKVSPFVVELYREMRPGHCIICDEPLPPRDMHRGGRIRYMHAGECVREYRRLFCIAYNAARAKQ